MRLNSIKLSGFKSFAEPTNFQLPGQLVGVVGPNGCGKSNIMDAVRWVLGESKASELRGESMQDVIFNGSGLRKPASRASVELAFSNEDGRAGGPWSRFAEIAVKRVLTRDGTSSYYINNQPVRRRDVQDVFLGTGLGPRAYAIIGQGTISRIIESKPEELRLFLEEAAGVSKYKERRRETETRLKDTRENLTRVEDILRELDSNLDKLEKQAEVASRYRAMQTSGELKLHQLWFLKHRDAASEEARVRKAVAEAVNALEARTAELRHGEAELETIRARHYAASDELHLHQGALAEAALEVSRLEERIRYVVEGRARVEQRLIELTAQNEQWLARQSDARIELDQIAGQIAAADEQGELLAAQAEEQSGHLPTLEDALRAAQNASNEQRSKVAAVQQQIQLLAAESRNLDDQKRQFNARRDRLAAERHQLAAPDAERLAELKQQHAVAGEAFAVADARLHELGEQVPALDDERRVRQDSVNAEGAKQADLSARLDALRALQEKVQTEGKLEPWLAKHGLDALAGAVDEDPHRTGLGDRARGGAARAHGRARGRPARDRARLRHRRAAGQARVLHAAAGARSPTRTRPCPGSATCCASATPGLKALLNDWLEGVYVAGDIDAALAERAKLTHGELIMTRDGHAVSPFAVAFYAPDSEQAGMLARAQEIENLERQLRAQVLIAEEARSALVRAEAALHRRVAAADRRAPRGRRDADACAPAAGRVAAPVAAGGADEHAPRAARRRTRRRRRTARGTGRTRRDRRGPLRGTRHAARRHAGAPRRTRRRGDRRRAPARRRARAAARAGARVAGSAVRGPLAGGAPRRTAARPRDRAAAARRQRAVACIAAGRTDAPDRCLGAGRAAAGPGAEARPRSRAGRRSAASTTT